MSVLCMLQLRGRSAEKVELTKIWKNTFGIGAEY